MGNNATGSVEIDDQWLFDVTLDNFEDINPNGWNAKTGTQPGLISLPLSRSPNTLQVPPGSENAMDTVFLEAAWKFVLDPETNILTAHLREDLSWSDGTPFTADNVLMHEDLVQARVGTGEGEEAILPMSWEALDNYTVEFQLQPGDAVLRMYTALHDSIPRRVSMTHPRYHRKFVEDVRSSTTNQEMQQVIDDLHTARFPEERLPEMSLGPFVATDWDPGKMVFESREDFPWGLHYTDDLDRVFRGIERQTVAEQQNIINAALAGENDWVFKTRPGVTDRLPDDEWETWRNVKSGQSGLHFSPKTKYGQKTEKSRKLRQAIAYLFDSGEFAKMTDFTPSFEPTTGFGTERGFENWIGKDTFSTWTNYGKQDTGYVLAEAGEQKFREAGFERNKSGIWVDSSEGEPLAPEVMARIRPPWGLTRPSIENATEQLNRMGVNATTNILSSDEASSRASTFDFDLGLFYSVCEGTPHPIISYREECGLGSRDGLSASIEIWDWRNGYRRVRVPMPVGNPEGSMTVFDWDRNVMEMFSLGSSEEIQERVKTLSWVMNQWVPALYLVVATQEHSAKTSKIEVTDEFDVNVIGAPARGQLRLLLASGMWRPPQ